MYAGWASQLKRGKYFRHMQTQWANRVRYAGGLNNEKRTGLILNQNMKEYVLGYSQISGASEK